MKIIKYIKEMKHFKGLLVIIIIHIQFNLEKRKYTD